MAQGFYDLMRKYDAIFQDDDALPKDLNGGQCAIKMSTEAVKEKGLPPPEVVKLWLRHSIFNRN